MKDSRQSSQRKTKESKSSSKFVLKRWHFYAALVLVFCLFLALWVADYQLAKKNVALNVFRSPIFSSFNPASYPVLSAKSPKNIDITAQAAIILDDKSKVALFSKNPTMKLPMASTAKLMTALVSLEHYKLGDIFSVLQDKVEGSKVGFAKGDKVTVEDLLYGLLLPSGNDAALVLAQNYPGGETAFVKRMNEKARSFHLFDTHFADVSGLSDDSGYTTPLDLARLSSLVLENPIIAKVVATSRKDILGVGTESNHTYRIENLNRLLQIKGVEGVKTGFTDGAKGVLVTSKQENGYRFIVVVMKSEDRFADTEKLFELLPKVNFLSTRRQSR